MFRPTRRSSIVPLFALLALLFAGFPRTGQAQNNWGRYTPGTIDAVIQQHDSSIKRSLWLPVQDSVASYFARELTPGQPVSLYVIWAGAYYAGEDITWTFLVNEFRAESSGQ